MYLFLFYFFQLSRILAARVLHNVAITYYNEQAITEITKVTFLTSATWTYIDNYTQEEAVYFTELLCINGPRISHVSYNIPMIYYKNWASDNANSKDKHFTHHIGLCEKRSFTKRCSSSIASQAQHRHRVGQYRSWYNHNQLKKLNKNNRVSRWHVARIWDRQGCNLAILPT